MAMILRWNLLLIFRAFLVVKLVAPLRTSRIRRRLNQPRNFSLLSAQDIAQTVDRWGDQYPDLLRVYTAQDAYGLPTAGSETDCPFDTDVVGCLNRILVVQDFLAHPPDSTTSHLLPHVLWSGELHGDERVGPTTVVEATKLLLEATTCEGLPRASIRSNPLAWENELLQAAACRETLRAEYGLSDEQRQWIARLVTTRRLVVVPTANALGYYRNARDEGTVDPNRDFPYDSDSNCMQTITARTLNEVFRAHIFQLSLTFHGGCEMIGFEWGAPHYTGQVSPDDQAQKEIAKAYSEFAGGFPGTVPYAYGAMNDIVYPVNGGMEDWAYAASWDKDRVIPCTPQTFGGYDITKTTYEDATLRCYNMLVETSNDKIPTSDLGNSENILGSPPRNGHVTRNVRLAIMAMDLVQPYVKIEAVDVVALKDDLVPLATHSCRRYFSLAKPSVAIAWSVGGALSVDETELHFIKNWDNPLHRRFCEGQPIDATGSQFNLISTSPTQMQGQGNETFQSFVNMSSFQEGDVVALVARARVDSSWEQGQPKAHIVHSRRTPDYRYETGNGDILQGTLDWYSQPLLIEITSNPAETSDSSRWAEPSQNQEGSSERDDLDPEVPDSTQVQETTNGGADSGGTVPEVTNGGINSEPQETTNAKDDSGVSDAEPIKETTEKTGLLQPLQIALIVMFSVLGVILLTIGSAAILYVIRSCRKRQA